MENMVYFAEEVNPVFSLVVLVGRVLVSTCKKYWNSAKKPLDVKIMDAPGSSLAPCFYPQKASCNHLRLSQLITLLCGDLFRDILSRYIKPADLRSELDNNKQKLVNIFNKQQQNLIYPATGNTSLTAKDFDISIIYILLRNICNIPSHKAGWGKPPAKGDNSIAAGIEIIRLTRNSILAHSTSGMIEDPVFEAHWKELRDVVIQIETQLTGSDLYKRGVDFLHSCNLTSVGTETCHNEEKSMQDGKRTARFAELFDELAEGVPVEKIARLKDYIQNNCKAEDIASIKQAVSGRDCLRYLRDAKRFTSSDVLFVQYLFKRIDCKEQFAKCYEYAEKQDALCFYEKPPAYGYKNVQFHVKGNLSEYSSERIAKIIENLAVLLNCTSEEILIEGACPSSSFLLVLSIKEAYLCKLLALEQCDKDKLTKLDIDYYIVDLTVIHLEPSKEFRWNIYFDPKHFDLKKYENILSQEEKSTVSPSQHMASVFKEKESSPDEDSEDSNSTAEIIFISGPTVVAPSAKIELRVDYQSNQGVNNAKWMKIKNFITNELTFENPKYSIENSASTGLIQTQKVVISNAEKEKDSAAYQLSLDNMKSNKLNIFVDDCGKYSTEQEGNCLRFFALQTVSANAMRIAFDKMQPTKFGDKIKDFEQYCISNARNPKLKELLSNINANKPTSSKDLDISLMYVIIRNSTTNPTKPKNGWGKSPSESDINTADDIERIRLGRNRICHENALNMETSEFNKSVLDLIWAIRRLSMDDVKLMGDVCDVMNKVFTKGEIMEGMIEQLYAFQKDAQNWEQLYQNEAPVPQEVYQRSSNEDIKFHSFHDSDILLQENGTFAIRHCMGGDGICLTNRPLKIGEKIHIRIVEWGFHSYSSVYSHFNPINIGTTSIPPERIFYAKNVKEAIMGRLNNIKTPWQWFAHSFHICISLCRNGSLLVCCEDTKECYPPHPDDPINTPLWLVIQIGYCGSVRISPA